MLLLVLLGCPSGVEPSTPSTPAPATPAATPPLVGAAPELFIRFPPSGEIDSESLAVFGQVTDADGDLLTVEVAIQGYTEQLAVSDPDGFFRFDDLPLAPGTAEVQVTVADATGRTAAHHVPLQVGPVLGLAPAVALAPDGDLLFGERWQRVLRRDATTGIPGVIETDTTDQRQVLGTGDDLFMVTDGLLWRIEYLDVVPLDPGVTAIRSISLEPTGDLALVVGDDHAVYRWDPVSTAPATLVYAGGGFPDVQVSGGDFGFGLARSSDVHRLHRVDYATGDAEVVFETASIDALHVTQAGVWVSEGGRIHLLDPFTGSGNVLLEDDGPIPMAPLDDEVLVSIGNRVEALAADGQTTLLLDRALGSGDALPGCLGSVGPADSTHLYTLCTTPDGEQSVWTVSLEDGRRTRMGGLPPLPEFSDLAWDPVGERLLVLSEVGVLRAVDPNTGDVTWIAARPNADQPCTQLVTDGVSAWAIRSVFDSVANLIQFDLATGASEEIYINPDSLGVLPTSPPALVWSGDEHLYTFGTPPQLQTELFTSTSGFIRGVHPIDAQHLVLGNSFDPTYQLLDLQTGVSETRPRPLGFADRSAVVVDGVLYAAQHRTSTALDVQTGHAVQFSR